MNTLKFKKTVFVLFLSASMLFGIGLLAPTFGIDVIPQTYACPGAGGGGGC